MTERRLIELPYEELNYRLINRTGRKNCLHSLRLSNELSEEEVMSAVLEQTALMQRCRRVLYLLADVQQLLAARWKRRAGNGVRLQSQSDSTAYTTCLLQFPEPARFGEYLREAWEINGNEPLCWFWSDQPLFLGDVLDPRSGEVAIDLSVATPVLFYGMDGDELLIYSLA